MTPTIPPRVGILTRGEGTPNVQRLLAALAAAGARAWALRPAQALAGGADLWFTRLPSGTPAAELAELDAAISGPWLNGPEALRRCHHKGRALALLAAAGLPVPPTRLLARDGTLDLAALPGEALVVKPVTGHGGLGVQVRLPRAVAAARAAAYADLCGEVLVQTFLGEGLDRRLLLVDGRLVASMERAPGHGGRGSMAYGARARPWTPAAAELDLGLAAVATLGLDVAAVDLLEHDGRPLILEVNACPGLAAIEAVTGVDVASALARAALARVPPV